MRAGQAKNVTMLYDAEYDDFVAKMNEFKNQSYKMTPYDFSLLKRFEILRVEKDGEIFDRLVKPKTRLRFVTYEGLYGAIKEVLEEGIHRRFCHDLLGTECSIFKHMELTHCTHCWAFMLTVINAVGPNKIPES